MKLFSEHTGWITTVTKALRGPHAGLIPLVVSFSRLFRPLEIRCGNRPFGPPSPLRPAVNWCTSTVLHTSYNLQFHQSQLTYEPVRLWSVDGNRNTRRKIPGERTNSVQTEFTTSFHLRTFHYIINKAQQKASIKENGKSVCICRCGHSYYYYACLPFVGSRLVGAFIFRFVGGDGRRLIDCKTSSILFSQASKAMGFSKIILSGLGLVFLGTSLS